MTNYSYFPADLIAEIFSQLPLESLTRFKLVTKSWYTLINGLAKNTVFVAKHLHNSKKKKESSLIFKGFEDNINMGSLTIYNDEQGHKQCLRYVKQDFKQRLTEGYQGFLTDNRVRVSHCDGIVCLVDHRDGRILLWNPTTRDFKLLPRDPCFHETEEFELSNVGLGYDSIVNVYKVVTICLLPWGEFKAHVYTLGSDHTWRDIKLEIKTNSGDHSLRTSATISEMHHKGVYYWLLQDMFSYKIKLYSFDMHAEEFRVIRLPRTLGNMFYKCPNIANLAQWNNESVVMFFYPPSYSVQKKTIEMYVLQELSSGNKSSCWRKHLEIDHMRGVDKIPVAFWTKNELLIRDDGKGLFSYNILTKKVRRICKGDVSNFYVFCHYVKSLISVSELDK